MNTVVLVGRLAQDPEIRTGESGIDTVKITVAVNRTFKNQDGIYETDFIDVYLWDVIAKNVTEFCKKGDTIGARGRLQVTSYDKEDGTHVRKLEVIGERITFLSSSKAKLEDNNDDENIVERNNKKNNNNNKKNKD